MLSSAYAKFRGSAWFLALLCLFIAGWVALHNLIGFDPEWGMLNLILSSEASISVALLIMSGDSRDAADAKQQQYLVDLMEAQVQAMEAMQELLKR